MTQLRPHLDIAPQQAATAAREAQPTVADLVLGLFDRGGSCPGMIARYLTLP